MNWFWPRCSNDVYMGFIFIYKYLVVPNTASTSLCAIVCLFFSFFTVITTTEHTHTHTPGWFPVSFCFLFLFSGKFFRRCLIRLECVSYWSVSYWSVQLKLSIAPVCQRGLERRGGRTTDVPLQSNYHCIIPSGLRFEIFLPFTEQFAVSSPVLCPHPLTFDLFSFCC